MLSANFDISCVEPYISVTVFGWLIYHAMQFFIRKAVCDKPSTVSHRDIGFSDFVHRPDFS
jgi:hypothetical protein